MRFGKRPNGSALGVVFLAVVAACSGSSTEEGTGASGGSGGTGDPLEPGESIPEAQYVDQYIDALCSGMASCCETLGLAANAAACRALLEAAIGAEPYPMGGGEGYAYDGEAAAVCLAALRTSIAACHEVDDGGACRLVYVGNRAPGEPCEFDEDCASIDDGYARCSREWVCEIVAPGQLGDACTWTCTYGGVCGGSGGPGLDPNAPTCWTDDGLFCASDGTCQALLTVGASCSGSGECVDDAYCSEARICEARKPAGEPCTDLLPECQGFCDEVTGLCQPQGGTIDPITFDAAMCAGEAFPDFD